MIKLENTEVMGWEAAIRGMRNPMNSWDRSDSGYGCNIYGTHVYCRNCNATNKGSCMDYCRFSIGLNDQDLVMRLANGGPVHAKYRRMITVYVDITAPLYWWKEFDTYKVGTVANSCSTMHKIHEKEFTLDDFSHEHLEVSTFGYDENDEYVPIIQNIWISNLEGTIRALNLARRYYNQETDADLKKEYWWQMIQLLPSSYNQKRTIMLNYEVLANIYKQRKNHKLDEWRDFCEWIESLPYSEIIIGKRENDNLRWGDSISDAELKINRGE